MPVVPFTFLESKMLSHFSATFFFAICLITLQSYPQYWPSKGTVRYGKVTLEMLSETSSSNVTTRKFSVLDAEVCPIIATQLVFLSIAEHIWLEKILLNLISFLRGHKVFPFPEKLS